MRRQRFVQLRVFLLERGDPGLEFVGGLRGGRRRHCNQNGSETKLRERHGTQPPQYDTSAGTYRRFAGMPVLNLSA
jgi:hypothetical protein